VEAGHPRWDKDASVQKLIDKGLLGLISPPSLSLNLKNGLAAMAGNSKARRQIADRVEKFFFLNSSRDRQDRLHYSAISGRDGPMRRGRENSYPDFGIDAADGNVGDEVCGGKFSKVHIFIWV